MAAILVIVVVLLCVAALLARQAVQKIRSSIRKAGVQLTWSSISSTSVKCLTIALEKGPLQSLTIDSIAWGPAARSRNSDTSAADSSTQQSTASAWLPVRVTGLRIVISSSARGRVAERKPKAVKRAGAGSKAKAAAMTPAVSSALALARRLLPHLPIQLQQVAVDLQATGLSMQLKSASLHWSVSDATVGSMLLLQDLVIVPAGGSQASVDAELSGGQSMCVLCPLAKLSIGIEGGRGMLPISCSHLAVQVGQVRVTGLSQFLALASAATAPGRPAAAVQPKRQASLDVDLLSEAGTPTTATVATSRKVLVPGDVAKAAGLMPDKVKLGFAGIKIVQCAALPAGAEPLQVLPQLHGSVGVITLAASSCHRPAAVRAGEKLLSMSFSLSTVQLKAAGGTAAGGISNNTSSASPAVEVKLAGISVTADLAKAANCTGSNSNNEELSVGPLQQHLFNRQQSKQQHQLQASCSCKLLDRPTVQVHAHQVPALVQSVELLLHSLQHLERQRQEAATSSLQLTRSQEQHSASGSLSRENSFPPLPHPDTPGLGTPRTPGPLYTLEGSGASQRQGLETSSADGSTRTGTGFIATSPLAAGAAAAGALQQRLASFRRGPAVAEYSSVVMDVTIAVQNGISVEVLTGNAAPAAALSLQLEGGAHAEWASPINSSASGMSVTPAAQPAKQRGFSFAVSCSIQQVSVSIATAGTNRPHMQQLLLLDLLELRATSTDSMVDMAAVAADAAGMALSQSTSPLACDVSLTAGQLQLTPSAEILAAALQLAEQAYVVPARAPAATAGGFGSAHAAAAGSRALLQRRARKRRSKRQPQVASLDVMLQSLTVTYSRDLPVCQNFGTPAALEAAARGLQSQLAATITTVQLSMQPAQQYLAASVQLLQVGYSTSSQNLPKFAGPQSVELLLMQGMEFRRYLSHDLQLLKIFLQQLRSEVHVDAAVSAAGMVEASLQQMAATVQRLQDQHVAAAAANAEHHLAVLGIADAAVAVAGVAAATETVQSHNAQGLAAEDSFTALAGRSSPSDSDVSLAAAQNGRQQIGLPPLAPGFQNGQMPAQEQQQPLLALEARLQDVAVQVSVCEHDALMVQMDLVKYSSVLEQGIVEKLRFSINERSVILIPHLAVHQLPGWLPPGAAAGAAALGQQQRAWSPDRGGSGGSPGPPGRPDGPRHKSWSVTHDEVTRKVTAGGSPGVSDRQYKCSTSYESVRFCDDGGVQSWQSIDDPVPSASLGSRMPPSSKDPALYQRQAARQQAGRDRCKVPQAAADSSAAPDNSSAAELISLDVYAERVLFSVPHDEAPGRVILVCETWTKAVKQVVLLQLKGIKESLVVMKTATARITASLGKQTSAAKAPKARKVKPAYLELQAHLQQIVFCLEQNPLETWMGLHGPILQAMVAERHLVEQLLTSCSSAHGRISRTGGSSIAAHAKSNDTVRKAMQLPAADGKKQRAPVQKRRWGSLGRRTTAVTTAIAAGSAVDAVVAATAGPAAAALAALAPEPTSMQQGLLGVAIPASEIAAAVAAAESGGDSQPTSPRADLAAATPEVPFEAETAVDADGHLDPAAEGDLAASDESDEVDSSDDEDAAFVDPDVLAAVLPSSASGLAGAGAAAPDAAAGSADTGAGSGEDLQKVLEPAQDRVAAGEQGGSEMQQAVLQAHMELFSMYKFRCRPLHAASEDIYHHSRAVMHVSVARAEAVVLISLPGHAASDAMAMEVIKRVDPASEGIVMERFQSISLDVGLQDIVAHFGGVEEMAATVGSLGASGLLIRARQLSAPPQIRPMRMCVGTWHQADVPVVVKGTRPPMKMYTDIRAELDDVQGAFCPGLEAPFGQLNLAFKRITVPNNLNPDGSVPPSTHPGLPWWDMMGYMWRGVANVRLRGLTAVLANTENPHVGTRDEKLALTAATLGISAAAGKIDVTTTNMSAVAHAAVPDAAPGDSLLVLPAFHLPLVTLTFNISNKLPGGRNALLHHCFPIRAEPAGPDTSPQEFVDVFSLMKSEGWCLGIDIVVSSDKTPTAGTAMHPRMTPGASTAVHSTPGGAGSNLSYGAGRSGVVPAASSAAGPSGVAASCWHYYQPYTIPHAFIGQFQMKYIIEMVDTLANPTAVVRISRKLKPFYARDRRPEAAAAAKALAAVRSQIVQMPLLKQRVDISLLADVYRVHHDAQDSEDPSDMVYIHLSSVRYMNTFTYSRYKRTQQLSNGSRLKDSMRQFMASLTVEAYDLKIVKPYGDQLSAVLGASVGFSTAMPSGQQTPTGAGSRRPAAAGVPGCVDQADRVRSMWDPRTPPRSGSGAVGSGSPSRGSPLKGQSRDKSSIEEDGDVPGFSQGLIAAAACFLLRQAPTEGASGGGGAPSGAAAPGGIPIDPPPVPKCPIHMIAQDVRLLCPAELRDTGMLLFHHMQKSFSGIAFGQPRGSVRVSTKKQQAQQADSLNDGLARDRSDGLETGCSLGRSSAPVSSAVGASAAGPLTRQSSADMPRSAAGPGDARDPTSAGGATGSAAAAISNNTVSTPLEEEVMLQRILRENQAATAARAKLQAKRRTRSIGELSSTNSKGSGTAAGGAAAADRLGSEALSDTAAGSDHAAAAGRAVQGTSHASRLSVAAASDGADSPRSATPCDSAGRATEACDSPQHHQGAASGYEEVLLEYEIQFVQVQVNLVSDSARGSLVLGTNSAQLLGHLNVSKFERSVSFKMDQVQAHVACSEMDPRQGPLWLEIANGKLSTPRGAEDVMRQVLLPFKCQLVTTKQATSSATAAGLNSSTQAQLQLQPPALQQRSDQKSSSSGLPPAGFAPAGQELRLHVPSIGARLDSRQFEVLVDVIQNIAMAPMPVFPPSVRGMWQHPDGTSEDDDNQDVLYALETLQSLRERQRGLQQELLTVWQAHQQYQQLQQQYAQLAAQQQSRAATRYPGSVVSGWDEAPSYGQAFSEYSAHAGSTTSAGQQQGVSSLAVPSNQGPLHTDVKEAATAMVIALASAGALSGQQQHPTAGGLLRRALAGPASMGSSSSALRAAAAGASNGSNSLLSLSWGSSTAAGTVSALQQTDQLVLVSDRQTLIWWAQEQLQGALDAITASRVVLNLLRNEAGLLKVRQRDSLGVSLTVDTIDWALSKGNTVIVQGELQGISYQSIRSEDHTGTTKIQLHTATFKDPKAAAAAAASTSKAHSGSQGPHNLDPDLPEYGSTHSSAAASTDDTSDAGVILAPWNPDESWERDELVRIYAIHGALEKRHVVYEHIEVLVHPIRVHLTAVLAAALQDYFNLKDEDNKLQSGVAGKGGKQAGTAADKRRTTAPGDLPAAGGAGTSTVPSTGKSKAITGSSSSSATPSSSTVGPLTAAAPRSKASIFHRRAAAQAAAKAATAAAAAAAAAQLTASAAGNSTAPAQPQIVVPPINMGDVNIHSLTISTGSSLASADSPASELPAHVAGAASEAVVADDASSFAAGSIGDTAALSTVYAAPSEVDSGYHAASVTSAVSAGSDVLLPASPGRCVQPVSADAALMMRYGAVVRGRAGRAAAATPSTPVGSAGGAPGLGVFTTAAAGGTGAGSSGGYVSSTAGAGGSSGTPLTPSGGGGGAFTPGAGAAAAAAAAAVKKPVRSILFKHVRFNRMHAKLTYEGPPLSISGFGLVLDNRVYRNIDGGWRSVLNRYKWDAIRSLVKSFSGLQARKLQELQIPSYGAEPADTFDSLRSSSGFKAGLMSLLKGKRPAGAGKSRMNSTDSQGLSGGGGYNGSNDDPDGSVRDGSVAGEDGVSGAAVLGGGSDYVVLMRDAVRAKHKAKKIALLLGNVPPLPQQPMAMEM